MTESKTRRSVAPRPEHPGIITTALVRAVLADHVLDAWGIHGLGHWARVFVNARRLAGRTGADTRVTDLFALFHDARRQNDHHDPEHGLRGARLAVRLRGTYFELDDRAMQKLFQACALHTSGHTSGDPTIGTCWDADRLDLPRVGIPTDPARLCTEAAREPEVLRWAEDRACRGEVPAGVLEHWLDEADRDRTRAG